MSKLFSVYNFLYEQDDGDFEEENESQMDSQNPPNQGAMAPGMEQGQGASPQLPEKTPGQNVGSAETNSFSSVLGATISDVAYEPVGVNGGRIKIKTSSSHIPLEVSWVGQKVTVTQPDGKVVLLSGGEDSEDAPPQRRGGPKGR